MSVLKHYVFICKTDYNLIDKHYKLALSKNNSILFSSHNMYHTGNISTWPRTVGHSLAEIDFCSMAMTPGSILTTSA